MITLLTGKKGSGKTKKLIELANAALETSKGCVVVIEKGLKLTYDISHAARLVDADAYKIQSADMLFGFVSGICAGNYDVKEIFIDSTLKAVDVQDLECFIKKLDKLAAFAETKITLSVSMDESELPAGVKDIVTCI